MIRRVSVLAALAVGLLTACGEPVPEPQASAETEGGAASSEPAANGAASSEPGGEAAAPSAAVGAPDAATGSAAGAGEDCDPDNGGLELPQGFCATVFADDLGQARHLTVDDDGDVYVQLRQSRDGHGSVALRDTDGDGRADRIERFGNLVGTGIGIHAGHLYRSGTTEVRRNAFRNDDELVPSGPAQTVVAAFPRQSSHAAKSFAFDDSGYLYVNVGGPSNACQQRQRTRGSPGQDPCPQLERQGGIWRASADKLDQTQQAAATRFATGIRNAVALAWNPMAGELYAVQHGRDQLHELFPELYSVEDNAELPAEELFRVNEGDDFGWPYCYYDPRQEKKVLGPEYGGDGQEVGRCADAEDPVVAFPGHWSPNDILFYTADAFGEGYTGGAFIAFHGSWNRAPLPQAGYNVTFVPFDGSEPSGDYRVFADGFAGGEAIESPSDAEYRPTGLAQGPDGALYISDSRQGRIWKVVRTAG